MLCQEEFCQVYIFHRTVDKFRLRDYNIKTKSEDENRRILDVKNKRVVERMDEKQFALLLGQIGDLSPAPASPGGLRIEMAGHQLGQTAVALRSSDISALQQSDPQYNTISALSVREGRLY